MIIRDARPDEYERIGEITVGAYVADGYLSNDSEYAVELRNAARRAKEAELIVAVDDSAEILGSVTFCLAGTPYAQIARDGEAEFRMLSVAPAGRGRGVGTALVQECLARARAADCSGLVLLTTERMRIAHRIYERLGFRRAPERDWWPRTDLRLMAYEIEVSAARRA